jgi:hypothetical protein
MGNQRVETDVNRWSEKPEYTFHDGDEARFTLPFQTTSQPSFAFA